MGYSDWSDAAFHSRQSQRKATNQRSAAPNCAWLIGWIVLLALAKPADDPSRLEVAQYIGMLCRAKERESEEEGT